MNKKSAIFTGVFCALASGALLGVGIWLVVLGGETLPGGVIMLAIAPVIAALYFVTLYFRRNGAKLQKKAEDKMRKLIAEKAAAEGKADPFDWEGEAARIIAQDRELAESGRSSESREAGGEEL